MTPFSQTTSDYLAEPSKIDEFNLEQLVEIYNDLVFNVSFKDNWINTYYHLMKDFEYIPITHKITTISLKTAILSITRVIKDTLKYEKENDGTYRKNIETNPV